MAFCDVPTKLILKPGVTTVVSAVPVKEKPHQIQEAPETWVTTVASAVPVKKTSPNSSSYLQNAVEEASPADEVDPD